MPSKAFAPDIQQFILVLGGKTALSFEQIARGAVRRFGARAPDADEIATLICETYQGTATLRRLKRDLVVTRWLMEHYADGRIGDIRMACARRFGLARTPSFAQLSDLLRQAGWPKWMVKRSFRIDPDVAAWCKPVAPHMTLDALLAACRKRFGEVRAPSRSALHRYLRRAGIETVGQPHQLDEDREVATWIATDGRSLTLTQLRIAVVARFGAARAPSRSVLHRFRMSAPHQPRGWKHRAVRLDDDIAAWLLARGSTHTINALRAGCVARFGSDRAPSRGAIFRLVGKTPP